MTSRRMTRERLVDPPAVVIWGSLGICGLAAGVASAACDEPSLPGVPLGTYDVTGALTSNTCGPDLVANATGTLGPFSVTMSESQNGNTLYWSSDYGNTTLAPDMLLGPLAHSSATITSSVEANVDGSEGVAGPCCIETDQKVVATLATGSPPSTFTGALTWSYSAVAGTCAPLCTSSDPNSCCADQLLAHDGMFLALPCSFSYSVTGSLQ